MIISGPNTAKNRRILSRRSSLASRRAKVQIMEKRYLKFWVSGVADGFSDGLGWCFSGSSENCECPLSDSPSACVACATHPTVGSDNSALLFTGRVCELCSRTPSAFWRNSLHSFSDDVALCSYRSSENSECPLSDSPSACVACATHPTVGSDNSALLFTGRVCELCSRTPSTSW